MNPTPITIDIIGMAEAAGKMQRIRSGLADRRPLHAAMAVDAQKLTADYVSRSNRHASAQRLGAAPSGFRERAAKRIEGDSNAVAAVVRIPRNTGLGRAFYSITLLPGSGHKFLTIPACAATYGKVVRDFPHGTFAFVIFKERFPVLIWTDKAKAGGDQIVAYWLRKQIYQPQDRTLLPSNQAYEFLGSERAKTYLASLIYRAP